MGNRMIKDTIRTSKTVNQMTDFQFRVWVYLITYVDDYGRGSADPELIKGFVFPRRKRISESDIKKTLAELAGMGCISLYSVDGESYFCFPNWGKHQRIQTKKSKFPAPEESDLPSIPEIRRELRWDTVSHREPPPETETKIETETESEPESPHTPQSGGQGGGQGEKDAFALFWSAYPRKASKPAALKAFAKVDVPVEELLNAIARQKQTQQWQKDGGQFIPYPATWLNQKRWEDEVESVKEMGARKCAPPEVREEMSRMEKYLQKMREEKQDD